MATSAPIKWILFLSVLFAMPFSMLYGQREPILDKLEIFRLNGKVHIECIISQGFTCDGIRYYRSTDGLNYEQIGQVGGICGSPDFPVGYDFVDEEPKVNAVNYYKIEFGGFGFSDPVPIRIIDISSKGYKVAPNPVKNFARIYFDNPNQNSNALWLYDIQGKIILSIKSLDSFFELDLSNVPSGLYVFQISDPKGNKTQIEGKLYVQ